jgi:hypothetical protein
MVNAILNSILTFFFRWRDRPRPAVRIAWSGGWNSSSDYIDFGTRLTNDGTRIARGVTIEAFLDDEHVYTAPPIDVPTEASPISVNVRLTVPSQARLSKALGDQPVFHRRTFSVKAEGQTITWPHVPEPEELDFRSELVAEMVEKHYKRENQEYR